RLFARGGRKRQCFGLLAIGQTVCECVARWRQIVWAECGNQSGYRSVRLLYDKRCVSARREASRTVPTRNRQSARHVSGVVGPESASIGSKAGKPHAVEN